MFENKACEHRIEFIFIEAQLPFPEYSDGGAYEYGQPNHYSAKNNDHNPFEQ
jgi:hypothetical protein